MRILILSELNRVANVLLQMMMKQMYFFINIFFSFEAFDVQVVIVQHLL